MNVRIYVNGVEVKEEDLCKYEIKNERVKRILMEASAREDNRLEPSESLEKPQKPVKGI